MRMRNGELTAGKCVGTLLAETARIMEKAGIDEAQRNAEWMLEEVLQCSRTELYLYPERTVSPASEAEVRRMVERRIAREPIQYIVGHVDFFGLRLEVDPGVLIPRPETEQVVEHALSLIRGARRLRILDVGTGSGCIALALKHERPDAEIFACDVSVQALEVARRNADRYGGDVHFFPCDILSSDDETVLPASLDLLISNPPYIPEGEAASLAPEVADHEPHEALFAGADPLLFYRRIVGLAPNLLNKGGHVVFEAHALYAAAVAGLMRDVPLSAVAALPDLAGHARIVAGQWEG
jgi:release factor glutamine methyltransferase